MCGIVGIVNLDNKKPVSKEVLKSMTDTLVHRGPDDSGEFIDRYVAFGHRRLSIIDLSKLGKQPMSDIKGRAVIIYNGEIYNYREIKRELIKKGNSFKSKSDTEVILSSYLSQGENFIHKLRGIFAFALYDKVKKKVFIFRDRIGVKPLYYSEHDGKLIFSSEIKAILKFPGFDPAPDFLAISSYLSFRYPIEELSFFNNIRTLLPGYYIEIELTSGKYIVKQYWELPIISKKEDRGEEYYVEKIKEMVFESIKYRMISDVPIGAYLSGGLDSSIVTAVMSQFADEPVKTFTIGFEEKDYNEFKYARIIANMYDTDHHEILLSKDDYIRNMISLIRFKDMPLGIVNEPALYAMSKELKKYITVVLSGEGADEIFGGYGRIFRSPFDYERLMEIDKNIEKIEYIENLLVQEMVKNLKDKYGDIIFSTPVEHFLYLYQYINWEDKKEFLSGDFLKNLDNDLFLKRRVCNYFEKTKGMSLYDQYMWIFTKMHIVGLLHRVDTATMATSVEGRVPFLDHNLVEFVLSIPFKYKIKWKSLISKIIASVLNSDQISENFDIPKYILKKAFKEHIPDTIISRKKVGFPVPVHLWFGDDFKKFTKDILLSKKARERGIYNIGKIEKLLDSKKLFKTNREGLKVWMLLNLELWFKEYIDKK